jgi:hypothetical protein
LVFVLVLSAAVLVLVLETRESKTIAQTLM